MKRRIKLTESDLHKIIKESVKRVLREWDANPNYTLEDEADGAILGNYDNINDAIEDARQLKQRSRPYGKYIVRDCKTDEIVFDTDPNISYKI